MKNVAEVNFDLCIELAALREENERLKSESFEELYNAAIDERDALREELANAMEDIDTIADYNIYLQQHLVAAEQRNSELCKHLTQAHRFVEATYGMADSGILTAGKDKSTTWNIDESKATLKPTESGARE